jgi:hypothetical protein
MLASIEFTVEFVNACSVLGGDRHTLSVGNRKGWRLPTLQELASLIDPSAPPPTLPPGHPFIGVQSSGYWSASTYVNNSGFAWLVTFSDGSVETFGKGAFPLLAWCVRGGHGVDPQ